MGDTDVAMQPPPPSEAAASNQPLRSLTEPAASRPADASLFIPAADAYLLEDEEKNKAQAQHNQKIRDLLTVRRQSSQQQQPQQEDDRPASGADVILFSPERPPARAHNAVDRQTSRKRQRSSMDAVQRVASDPSLPEMSPLTDAMEADDDESALRPPWLMGAFSAALCQNAALRLHEEIVQFCRWIDPAKEERTLRRKLLSRVREAVRSIWPNATVDAFGSYRTGLYLPNGDLDIVVDGPPSGQNALKKLASHLLKMKIARAMEVITRAKVPIVKFIDKERGVPVDISFNQPSAITTTDLIVQKLKEYPVLRPMLLLLKLFLQQRNLAETYRGGVGSYLLFGMVLSFLQHHPATSSKNRYKTTSLGHYLYDFMKLYGNDLRYDVVGISVEGRGRYFNKRQRGFLYADRRDLLAFESPLDPDTDLGRNAFQMPRVRVAFQFAYQMLSRLFQGLDPPLDPSASLLCSLGIISPKDPILHARRRPWPPPDNESLGVGVGIFVDHAQEAKKEEDAEKKGRIRDPNARRASTPSNSIMIDTSSALPAPAAAAPAAASSARPAASHPHRHNQLQHQRQQRVEPEVIDLEAEDYEPPAPPPMAQQQQQQRGPVPIYLEALSSSDESEQQKRRFKRGRTG
ncbi:unnamed protein product [Vitrella brassicaformis CCMP3155]|uniref:polynucleotide adenylyltransferase n=3 Tax=Vitrella brassicaformis TaxID=1169539 RepID=A0A0G4GKG9_VITBC|nr:unnamed protein product [Vitrella brassicaformis CCMP3155]|eukprot:CEM30525.1 unnamed protein product [Vitrella brassicaformis CCMP3155]